MDKLLHTPEGVRDIYNSECETKLQLEQALRHKIHHFGFQDIQTPTFEFYDIFGQERGSVASREMYKFFDREGNTLALRPDITPSIARCIAKYYKEEVMPIRLCYGGSTFMNSISYQGKLKESTQLGAELINDGSVEADAEMIVLTVECLKLAGLKEFQVEIGEVDFFRGLAEEAKLSEAEVEQLRSLIEEKNMFGIEDIILESRMDESLKELFLRLPEMFGSMSRLHEIKQLVNNRRALHAVTRLEQLYELLVLYGVEKYISFDLGMLSKYNYYTGIIFRAYTYGSGDAVITGGRYDGLVSQFGKDAPAVGMAILIDQLLITLSRQKLIHKAAPSNTLFVYQREFREAAIALTKHFRDEDMDVVLVVNEDHLAMEEYITYAKRIGMGGMLYLEDTEMIQIVNLLEGTSNRVALRQLF